MPTKMAEDMEIKPFSSDWKTPVILYRALNRNTMQTKGIGMFYLIHTSCVKTVKYHYCDS